MVIKNLLEFIGQASEDTTINQTYIKMLLQCAHSVKFDTTSKNIVSIYSSFGETADLEDVS